MQENNKNNYSINLKELTDFALGKWKLFICLAALFIAAAYVYSSFLVTPLYDSTGKIYIMNKNSDGISTADISVSTYLTRDYENLIADSAVLSEVSAELGKKYLVGELKRAVSVKNPDGTRFIEITVRTASANDSKVIVDTVCTVAQKKIIELLGVDRVTIYCPQGRRCIAPLCTKHTKKYTDFLFNILSCISIYRFYSLLFRR